MQPTLPPFCEVGVDAATVVASSSSKISMASTRHPPSCGQLLPQAVTDSSHRHSSMEVMLKLSLVSGRHRTAQHMVMATAAQAIIAMFLSSGIVSANVSSKLANDQYDTGHVPYQ